MGGPQTRPRQVYDSASTVPYPEIQSSEPKGNALYTVRVHIAARVAMWCRE